MVEVWSLLSLPRDTKYLFTSQPIATLCLFNSCLSNLSPSRGEHELFEDLSKRSSDLRFLIVPC